MNIAIPEYPSFDKLIGIHAKGNKRLCREQGTDSCFHRVVLDAEKCTINVYSNLNGFHARGNLHSRSQTTEMLHTFVINWHLADVYDLHCIIEIHHGKSTWLSHNVLINFPKFYFMIWEINLDLSLQMHLSFIIRELSFYNIIRMFQRIHRCMIVMHRSHRKIG